MRKNPRAAIMALCGAGSDLRQAAAEGTFAIESSSDLASWSTIGHVINDSGAVKFVDPDAPAEEPRFYRARAINP